MSDQTQQTHNRVLSNIPVLTPESHFVISCV